MQIKEINIRRPFYYGQDDPPPFTATVVCEGNSKSLVLNLDENRTLELINLVADLITDASNDHISSLREDARIAVESFQQKQIELQPEQDDAW